MRPARCTSILPVNHSPRTSQPIRPPRSDTLSFRSAMTRRLGQFFHQKNRSALLPSSAISRPSTSLPSCLAALRNHVSVQSRSRHTSSAVTNRPPAGIISKPAATLARLRRPAANVSTARSPRRSSIEITFPTDRFERAARAFPVRSTSSSRSRVVLIAETQPHLLRSANHD